MTKAQIIERDGQVWMVKECPIHGKYEDMMAVDAKFLEWIEANFPGRDLPAHNDADLHNHGSSTIRYGRGSVLTVDLTNRCNMMCDPCFMDANQVGYVHELTWEEITEVLDNAVRIKPRRQMSIQFSGGEPTLHPEFVKICQYAAHKTRLSVSFTTHGHHVDKELADYLRGSVHFIRVSMDGVGVTYESIRRRSFADLLARLSDVRSISRFGVNVVVNERTLIEMDNVAQVAEDAGACELLLLPQIPVRAVPAIDAGSLLALRRWVDSYKGPLKLLINESSAEGFPTCDPLFEERGLRAYAHIDASGVLKASSYADIGVQLGEAGVLQALSQLFQDLGEKDV